MGVGGDGWWWWVGLGWVLQCVSVCFAMGFSGFQCVLQWVLMGSGVGWVSDGGGGLGIMLMVVIYVVVFG